MSEGQPTPFKDLPPDEAYQALEPKHKERLAQLAMKLFIKASVKTPASITAQGAIIAKECKSLGLTNPQLLSQCLTQDPDRINLLAQQGGKMHTLKGVGPKTIDTEKVKDIVVKDFQIATDFMLHTEDELDYIANNMRNKFLIGGYNIKDQVSVPSMLAHEASYHKAAMTIRWIREQQTKEQDEAEKRRKKWFNPFKKAKDA